jgi:dephospho-CoA kinase
MKFIGLTGGVGAGKTTVLKEWKRLTRSRILIADEIAHDLMEPGCDCYRRIREQFAADDIWLADGSINRPGLAGVLFSDEEKRKILNGIVHPAVKDYVLAEVERERQAGAVDYVILEAALLIEDHYDELCDELWYVYASPDIRKARLMADRGYSGEKVEQILAAQLPDETYRRYCKHVIVNDGDLEFLNRQLQTMIKEKP